MQKKQEMKQFIEIELNQLPKVQFKKTKKRKFRNIKEVLPSNESIKDKTEKKIVFNTKQNGILKVKAKILTNTKNYIQIEEGHYLPVESIYNIK